MGRASKREDGGRWAVYSQGLASGPGQDLSQQVNVFLKEKNLSPLSPLFSFSILCRRDSTYLAAEYMTSGRRTRKWTVGVCPCWLFRGLCMYLSVYLSIYLIFLSKRFFEIMSHMQCPYLKYTIQWCLGYSRTCAAVTTLI